VGVGDVLLGSRVFFVFESLVLIVHIHVVECESYFFYVVELAVALVFLIGTFAMFLVFETVMECSLGCFFSVQSGL